MMYAISQSYLPKIFTFEHPFIYSFFSILGLIERKGNERTNIWITLQHFAISSEVKRPERIFEYEAIYF